MIRYPGDLTSTHTLALLQYSLMHPKQKLWPQGVDDGLVNRSRQMEHWNCSSDNKLPCKDILWANKWTNTQISIVDEAHTLLEVSFIQKSSVPEPL